jgi:hypothetical protein
MSRNPTSSIKVGKIASFCVGFLLFSGAAVFLIARSPDTISHLPEFPVSRYLDGNGLWSEEDYKLAGKVSNVLLRSGDGKTLLVSIKPEASDTFLPIKLDKDSGKKKSIQKDQSITLKVRLDPDGVIVCNEYIEK